VVGAKFGVHPSSVFDVRGAIYSSTADSEPGLAGVPGDFFGISGFSSVPAGHLDDVTWKVNADVNDPFGVGLTFNVEVFDIGAEYVSMMASRREADVLLTEGSDAAFYFPGPSNAGFAVFSREDGGNRRDQLYGGWDGNAQQVPTINVDNEFSDFDEPMAESAIGWKGVTVQPVWSSGNLDLVGEVSFIDYNTNWQAWDRTNRPILSSVFPNMESDAGVFGGFRNAYAPFQEKETKIALIKFKYLADVGRGLDVFGKVKRIDEQDDRLDNARFLPYQPGDCPGGGTPCANVQRFWGTHPDPTTGAPVPHGTADLYGNPPVITVNGVTGYQWAPFDDLGDDDKDLDYMMYQLGAGYQLTDDLYASLTYELYDVDLQDGNTAFQAYQLHEMASGEHNKNKVIVKARYILAGAEFGLQYQYNFGDFKPDFGGGFVTQFADQGIQDNFGYPVGSPGFRGRFGGWNSLLERDFEQQVLKAFMKVQF
jgi:hypothetical protein